MEAILHFNQVILPFFGHDLQKMEKIILLPIWLDYGITELVVQLYLYITYTIQNTKSKKSDILLNIKHAIIMKWHHKMT